jgi:hypothetical protein
MGHMISPTAESIDWLTYKIASSEQLPKGIPSGGLFDFFA